MDRNRTRNQVVNGRREWGIDWREGRGGRRKRKGQATRDERVEGPCAGGGGGPLYRGRAKVEREAV